MKVNSMLEEIELIFTNGRRPMDQRFYNTTGKRLVLLRDDLGLDQGVVAQRTGIRQSYLSQIEHDRANPSAEIMARLAKELDTTTDFLLLLTDDPAKPQDNKPTLLSEEAEQIARMVDDMPPEGREGALRSVTGIYNHYEEHTRLNKQIMELLTLIESSQGAAFRRDLERRLGLIVVEKGSESLSL